MNHRLIMLALAAAPLLVAPRPALSQGASISETNAVARIAECLVVNAPDDWQQLTMEVHLDEPGAENGRVRYLAKRAASPDQPVAYTPCDAAKPAKVLIEARKQQRPERKGWTGARLVLHNDGKFQLNYDYPKKD
jgi:hypothetical protein